MKPRAITGLGIASALGTSGSADFFEALRSATTARGPKVEVPGFDPTKYLGDKGLRTLDRLTKLLVVAARIALHDAGLKKENAFAALSSETVGVCCSNAYGSLEAITELDRVAVLEDARYINPAKFPNTVSNSASGYVGIWEDLRALNVSVSDGNCGALDAVSCTDLLLATRRAEAILTGGGEAMSDALFLAFEKLGVFGQGGACLGEGAAFLVVEPADRAQTRGAKILAEIVGYGTGYIAPNDDVTLLFASAAALERAITQALEDAGTASVDLVVSGVAGIARFDDEERSAITKLLPGVPVAAPKLVFGETLGAGGALAMAAAVGWLGGVAPTCLLDGKPAKIETVLVTSVGYYGNASAVVLRAASTSR